MKWKDKRIEKLVLKKSNSHLKISVILFLLTLMMPVFFIIYSMNEQKEKENNYTNNDNIHMIRLDGKVVDERYYPITNQESRKLETLLNDKGYCKKYDITTLFKIVGITDKETENGIEIYGISKKASNWIIEKELQDETVYMKECNGEQIELSVPVLTMVDGGIEVNECDNVELKWKIGVKEDSPLLLYIHEFTDLQQGYVTEDTFLELLRHMYKLDEKVISLYAEEIENIVAVESIYVYVKDVYQIDEIANILKENGYCITYTFEAFDSLSTSLLKSNIILLCLLILIFTISVVNLIFSFWSYLKVQQKDMGILLFYGYSKKRLYRIYSRNINRVFIMVGGSAMILSSGIWLMVMKDDSIRSLFIILGLTMFIVLVVSRIVLWGPLKKYLKKDLLKLIKQSKEFE